MAKPKKPAPNKTNADTVRAAVNGEFWKIISSYLQNELAELSYGIIKKEYRGKELTDPEIDQLRKNLEFVEWHLNLPQIIIESTDDKQPEIPSYDPYPNTDDEPE